MGEETARLRAEIDQTRENLTRDVDLLAEKTSPSRIVERRVEKTKRGITGLKDKVMGTVSSSDDDEPSGYDYYGTGSTGGTSVGSKLGDARDNAGSAVSSAKDTVTGAASSAVGTVQGTVTGAASSVGDAATGAVGTVREQAEGNPLAAGLVAFGIGWLVSSLLPASQAEQRAARQAVEKAKEQGQPVI